MEIKKEIIINQPIEKVWDILGHQFGQAYLWASSLNHSEGYNAPKLDQAPCNNRACSTTQGDIKEVIRQFDSQNHVLAYEVMEGFPFFVKKGINTWRLSQKGKTTVVNIHLVIETTGLVGALMAPMMKLQMSSLLSQVAVDLKHYAETGKPSPNKAKELKKLAKAA